jgi:ADP-heptose:LPS heptosyltransferase
MTPETRPLLDPIAATRMRRVLVIQHWGIGDMLMTTPMLQALHHALPNARIDVVAGSRGAADVLSHSTYAGVCAITRRQEGGALGVARTFLSLRNSGYEVAIVATRLSRRMGQFARYLAGIPIVIGDGTGPKGFGYTHWRAASLDQHRVLANIDLARLLVDVHEMPEPRFDVAPDGRARGEARWAALGFGDDPVMAIHPGSSGDGQLERRLPLETVTAVIRSVLNEHSRSRVLIVLGPAEEALRPAFENLDERVTIATGMTLHETAYMLSRCKVILTGDSGLGHVAAAVGTRAINLSGATNVSATRPWGADNVVLRTHEKLACMPCFDTPLYGHCPYAVRCLTSIRIPDIVSTIMPMLKAPVPEAS